MPGDLLELREGDIIAADGQVVEAAQLAVDEAPLTGESQPIAKSRTGSDAETRVLMGTTVLSGRALVRVEATGPATEYGRVGTLVAATRPPRAPFQRVVRRLGIRLGAIAAGPVPESFAAMALYGRVPMVKGRREYLALGSQHVGPSALVWPPLVLKSPWV